MTKEEVLNIIDHALSRSDNSSINDVTYDNDNDSGEIILTTQDEYDNKQCWVIRSKDITETDCEA